MREGNFTTAAQALGATQHAVGRQIEALENQLGIKLFTRSPRGLRPTAEAMRLVPHAEQMAAVADTLLAGVARGFCATPSDRLRPGFFMFSERPEEPRPGCVGKISGSVPTASQRKSRLCAREQESLPAMSRLPGATRT